MILKNIYWKIARSINRISFQNRPSTLSTKFISEFKDFYPKLIDDAIAQNKYLLTSELKTRLKKLSTYYTMEKIPLQGELMIYAYELLVKPENINDYLKHQLYTVACMFETMQAYYIILDDQVDNCKMRCGKLCWHLLPEVQSLALNDASLLRSFIDVIIKQNTDEQVCKQVLDVFDETYFITDIGQHLDEVLIKTKNFANYTRSYYYVINHPKASRYGLISDLCLALALANKLSEQTKQLVEYMCDDLGVMIQVHNDLTDYLDEDGSLANKTSSDIPNGKCSWISMTALELLTPAQRKVFEKCYGSRDPEDVQRIRELYADLDVLRLYELEKQIHYDVYLHKIYNLPGDADPSSDFFLKILDFFNSYICDTSRYLYK